MYLQQLHSLYTLHERLHETDPAARLADNRLSRMKEEGV